MKLIARLKIFLKKNILVLVLIILCYFPIFHKLGDKNIRMWDESFYAVSAFEMSQNGNFLIKHFNNIPDIYNLKPPLVTWFQVICMKIFGYNELAVRIPSALSAFILVLIIIRFFKKDLNRPILGYFTALVIVTTDGFINSHVTRTGDYEAPLVLFLFISFMYFYKYVEFGNKRNKYLVLSTVFLSLAVLSKGIAGLMFLPAFFIYIVQRKKLLETLKSYSFYLSLGIFIFLVGGYYISREIIDPGYLARVLQFEMTGRYFHTLDGHNQHFWYYINTLSNWQFRPWLYFIPLSGFLLLFNKKDNLRRFYSFVLIIILSYLVIISLGQTKLEWYIAPIFPLLALFTSYVLEQLYLSILSIITLKREIMKSLFWILFIFAIFSQPYDSIIDKISQVNDNWDAVKYGTFIKKIKEESPELKEYRIIFDGWNSHILYYKEVLNTIYNYDIEFEITDRNPELLQKIFDDINVGDKIMMNQQNIINDLEKKFEMNILFSYDEIILVDVTSSTSTNQ